MCVVPMPVANTRTLAPRWRAIQAASNPPVPRR